MNSFTDDASLMSEFRTRKEYIDPLLERTGWLDKYIIEEVNSVKSDFKNKNFVYFNGSIERGVDRFIDYVLLDEDHTPLAIIEAKRFSKDLDIGRIQARSYAQDIEIQINYKVPIFLTNGQKWILIDEYGVERKVSGPFSQSDLKRRRDLYNNRKDPRSVKLNTHIVDRPRSVQIVRKLSEHFSECHRTALIEMATGTGKIVENVHYTSRQVEFLMLLKKVFSERKHIEMKDIGGPPFEDENPLDLFSLEELEGIVDKCNLIRMC